MAELSDATGHQTAPVAGADGAEGIGRRLASHRVRRGLRVAELARDVGVTPSLISQIERGQSRPSVSTLFALAQALDIPVDAFFRESPQPATPAQERTESPTHPRLGETALGETVPGETAPGETTPADTSSRETSPPPRHEAVAYDTARAGGRYLVRKETRAVIDIEGGVRWERLTRSTIEHLDFFELIYQPGAESHPRQYTHPGIEMVLVTRGCLEITVGFERYRLGPGDSIDFPSSMPHRYVNPGSEGAHAVSVIFYDCPGARDSGPGHVHPAP